ncbi:MAG: acetyl/propionyl/methylcrotonyl-CoA carboxylase subunit alpha [Alphaproteobacteria bacterium]
MFSKILIANRGEIACRIIKTARKMGIKTVAVYSEADMDALFVEMADEAIAIGAAPAAESYLRTDKIIATAKATGAQAIHPGYGFLSERASFAEALEKEGIAFIGPNARAIAAMGDKIESKKLAAAAGVSTVPGHMGIIKDAAEARRIANQIGYPVMIKASAGGGGKGMRIAHSEAEVEQGFASSMNEARGAFGDDRMFIEKFVTDPRHIEIQVLADKHGNVISLGERECSIQRRNQKVIEEAPSPFLDEKTRQAMSAQAIALAKAVGYDSAGTVEFIVDSARNFYFLEMNTRLQVEHAVTELVTGIDLVEQMIRVAAGEKLTITQRDVKLDGWAIEARIYAEDPFRNFLPSIGRIKRYRPPTEGTTNGLTIRNDTGVTEGSEISIYYDPMISKLCTHGQDRAAATAHMIAALNEFDLAGIEHNLPFLSSVVAHPRFQAGRLTTGFIAEEFPQGFRGNVLSVNELASLACVALDVDCKLRARIDRSARSMGEWVVTLDNLEHAVRTELDGAGISVSFAEKDIGTRTIESDWKPGEGVHRSRIDGLAFVALIEAVSGGYRLRHSGAAHIAQVLSPRAAQLRRLMPKKKLPDNSRFLIAPMPGRVVEVLVGEGQEVKLGEPLAIVEAMKMENVLKAERDGVVKKVKVGKGQSIAVDDVILEFA